MIIFVCLFKVFLHKVRILDYMFKTRVDQCRIYSHTKCTFKIHHYCQLLIHYMTNSILLLYQYMLNQSVLTYQVIVTRNIYLLSCNMYHRKPINRFGCHANFWYILLEKRSMYFAVNNITVKLKCCMMK